MNFVRYVSVVLMLAVIGAVGAGVSAEEDGEKSILRIAVPARPPGLGNPYSSLPIGVINSNHVLYDALTLIGDGGAILPGLALSWEPVGDAAWRFSLRPDVLFSNGEPFTAQTVVDVVTYLRSELAAGYLVAGETAMIESASVIMT